MQSEENNKTESVDAPQSQDQEVQPDTTANVPTNPTTSSKKSHKRVALPVAIVIVLLLLGGGAFALYHSRYQTKATSSITAKTSSSAKTSATVATNVWTGKANNYNWNEAANWSLGLPKNGQNLEIDVSKVTQPTDQYGHTSFAFQNNLIDLTINKLIIDGQVDSIIANIKGNPLTITGGIEDTISGTSPDAAIPQVQIDNLINFAGNALIKTTGKNMLTFYNNKGTAINLADKTIQFSASDTSSISVSGAMVGTGTIQLPANAIGHTAGITFETPSPDFKGKVVIGSGNLVNVGNQTTGGSYGTVDGFGSSSIEIMNGGAMSVFATGTTRFTINNDITISGNGVTNSDGSVTGAISACVTSAEQGCGANESITLAGLVKLRGNTQVGQSTPSSAGANNIHVSYTFSNLNKNGYTLNTLTDYHYSPNF
jgi:hypothetical protein